MIFALLFGLDRGGNVAWNDDFAIIALSASVILFALFGVIEMKLASEPVAPKRIVTNQALIAGFMINFFSGASLLTTLFHTSLYLQAVLGKTPSETGLFLLPAIAGGVIGSLGGGLIMQKSGKYYWLTVGAYMVSVIGIALVTLCTGILKSSPTGIAIGMILMIFCSFFVLKLASRSHINKSWIWYESELCRPRIHCVLKYVFRRRDDDNSYLSNIQCRPTGPSHCDRWYVA